MFEPATQKTKTQQRIVNPMWAKRLTPLLLLVFAILIILLLRNLNAPLDIPLWTPDGEWIVFACGQLSLSDSWSSLYLVRPGGSDLHSIVDSGFVALSPSWSPDGKLIALISRNRFMMVEANGSLRSIPTSPNLTSGSQISWSPTGESIAYSSEDFGGGKIAVIDPNTGSGQTIFHSTGLIGDLDWLSDGQHIVFSLSIANPRSASGIYVMTIRGEEVLQVVPWPSILGTIDVAANSDKLLFDSLVNRAYHLFTYSLEMDEMAHIPVEDFYGAATWSPGQDSFAFRSYSTNMGLGISSAALNGEALTQIVSNANCSPSKLDWYGF